MGVQGSSTLQTADDALAVLEHLASAHGLQPLTRLSRETKISKPRIHRLLATLKARGYVTQDPDTAHYGFGAACARLAAQARNGSSLNESCHPALKWLWEVTQETTQLAVLQAGHAVLIEKLDSPRPVVATASLGRIMPLHAVSSGKVLLAGRPDEEIRRLISTGLLSYTKRTTTSPVDLWLEIQKIRRQGYGVNREGFRLGVCGIAAPVRWSVTGPVAAAIATCVPAGRFRSDFDFLRDRVLEASAMASEALGAAP